MLRLETAARKGLAAPPVDLRYLRKSYRQQSEATGQVYSFLEDIYNSIAENLPDVRDKTADSPVDPYSLAVVPVEPEEPPQKKQQLRSVTAAPTRAAREQRWLPPGTMKEYYEQFLLQAKVKVSFPTFWTEPCPCIIASCLFWSTCKPLLEPLDFFAM